MLLSYIIRHVSSRSIIVRNIIPRDFSSRADARWDLLTSVCVERLPVVSASPTELQSTYQELLDTIETEKSLKSDHEIRHENDRIQAELLKSEAADVDLDTISKFTAQDFEDASTEELSKFKFANIQTDADRNNIKTSLDRSLQSHLVLVTEQQLGNDRKWILPQGKRMEGETLRQTAERVLAENCGSKLHVQFHGNAPAGFYKYKYPTEINGKIGAKVFFYYTRYIDGSIDESKQGSGYAWLTRNQLQESLPEKYLTSIKDFLVEERV